MRELARHHTGGRLKVAPEHTDPNVLGLMRKPDTDDFEKFSAKFLDESAKAGKRQQIVPYFIASHPGCDLDSMIELALFLKRNGYEPDQVQDFIPAPFDVATAMYYTGIDPFTKRRVYVAQHLRDRKLQRALMQCFKPENYFEVRQALREAGRTDLIGSDCDCLIPATPPREAILKRRRDAKKRFQSDYVHTIPAGKPSSGKSAKKRRPAKAKRKKQSKKESRLPPGRGYRPD
jgi:hypothetical protein